MANIQSEIKDLQEAINSPATPEAQKVVMRGILAKLQSKQGSQKSTSKPPVDLSTQKGRNNYLKTPGKIITYSDGFKWEVVPNTFAKNNWDNQEIFGLNVSEETEALIESENDLNEFNVFAVEYKGKVKELVSVDGKSKLNIKVPNKDLNDKSDTLGDYNCDELIEKEKAKAKKRKANALKKASEPKKTEATKNKERIEKVADVVETNLEKRLAKNEVSVEEIRKLIDETESLLSKLKDALKKAH